MKIKALITTLVLGSSSVAMARPVAPTQVRDHRTYPAPAPVDDCYDGNVHTLPAPAPRPINWHTGGTWNGGYNGGGYNGGYYHQPMLLGSGLHFAADGRTFLTVGLDKGLFNTVRIDGSTGSTMIQQVAIEFEGGQTQVVRSINRTLDGSRPLMLDLDGNSRRIARVVVYGQPVTGYGYRGREAGTFTVSLL